MAAIIALLTAIAVAIPTIWAWRVSAAKKKVEKEHAKQKAEISTAIHSGNIDTVRRTLARWL